NHPEERRHAMNQADPVFVDPFNQSGRQQNCLSAIRYTDCAAGAQGYEDIAQESIKSRMSKLGHPACFIELERLNFPFNKMSDALVTSGNRLRRPGGARSE